MITVNSAATWWTAALTSGVMVSGALVLVSGAVAIWGLGQWLHRLNGQPQAIRSPRRILARLRDSRGTVTLEFVLVFPIMLAIALMMLQTMLVMSGNIVLNYAAFAAARSAIVHIPRDLPDEGEPANVYFSDGAASKHTAIRRAAVFAIVPASGRLSQGSMPTDSFTNGWTQIFTDTGRTPPGWITAQGPDRLRYADAHTQITLNRTLVDSSHRVTLEPISTGQYHQFGPRDPITVTVTHKLALSIPLGSWPYASGRHSGSGSGTDDSNSYYTLVSAHCTLTNEGLSTALPEAPSIPRTP